ncbi:histidine phosphatase family protein [Arthrobacter caoxuetaonis]|uniref:Histidine phosphatase family protein n=1 Tax=Arthrobacter caoxuetaonis TaxID=2886935 RepID=A0A9X1SDV1_9MICC|nr:histidine phosphatase family protein [Arthrobacter caoxuetaonis]MCC3299066.1 histidine phosphatase family protein [Arthrobacter caoxuetaonis]USQ58598.1 histidine phosphatase family protein [Arthrobacter caoxuetaonis]
MSGASRPPERLVLVRHGETDWNQERRLQGRTDNPLNGVGRAQARTAGLLLAADPWSVVVSSPLLRAVQTAHIIADAAGLQPAGTMAELIERDYGSAEGLHLNGLTEPEFTAALGTGEPERAVARRGLAALRGLASQFPGQRIIAVAHGTLIRLTLSELTGQRCPRVLNGEVVEVPLAALLEP